MGTRIVSHRLKHVVDNKYKKEKFVKYEFSPEMWGIIKEYMGVPSKHYTIEPTEDDYGDDEVKWMTVSWDFTNTHIDKKMDMEYALNMKDLCSRRDLTFLEDVKKFYGWKKGDHLYLCTKCNCDGTFYIYNVEKDYGHSYVGYKYYIMPDGYCEMVCYDGNYKQSKSIKIIVESKYNDNICESLKLNV
jgi:hypothetical protein